MEDKKHSGNVNSEQKSESSKCKTSNGNYEDMEADTDDRNDKDCVGKQRLVILIIGLCILLRVYQLNTGRTSVCNKVFFVLDFIVHFSHYMFPVFKRLVTSKKEINSLISRITLILFNAFVANVLN
jgi:hypothetical protein